MKNKPLDRNYFKYKDRPKKKNEAELTPCCNQSVDQKVLNDDISIDFEIDEFKKKCLIEGLDEIGLTLQQSNVIKEFEKNYYKRYPWLI